jgi:PPE family
MPMHMPPQALTKATPVGISRRPPYHLTCCPLAAESPGTAPISPSTTDNAAASDKRVEGERGTVHCTPPKEKRNNDLRSETMDFALLPPEINSARMHTGPGSGPLRAAAGSCDSLAAELSTTVETYQSVISGLTSLQWRGPAAAAMAATAVPHVGWLYTTAAPGQIKRECRPRRQRRPSGRHLR